MTEADAFRAHHPVDHASAFAACAETVPEIFFRADHETWFVVVVEGAQADEVRAVPFQLHAVRLGQTFDGDFALEPLDLLLRDACHRPPFLAVSGLLQKPCQVLSAFCGCFLVVREFTPFWYILSKSPRELLDAA